MIFGLVAEESTNDISGAGKEHAIYDAKMKTRNEYFQIKSLVPEICLVAPFTVGNGKSYLKILVEMRGIEPRTCSTRSELSWNS